MKVVELGGVLTAVRADTDPKRHDGRNFSITIRPIIKGSYRSCDTTLSVNQEAFEALADRLYQKPSSPPFTVKITVELVEHPPLADLHPAGGSNQGG
jgi:hypothetical protein